MKPERLLILPLVLLLSGCSVFSFVFERLDWYILWKLDQMFALNDRQEEVLEPEIRQFHTWLREAGLPIVIETLTQTMGTLENGQPHAAFSALEASLERFSDQATTAATPALVVLSMNLTEENARAFQAYAEAHYEEWFEESKSRERKLEETATRYEALFGDLSDAQVALIDRALFFDEHAYSIRLENSRHWRQTWLSAALAREEDKIRRWLKAPDALWTATYRTLRQREDAASREVRKKFLDTLTPAQTAHALAFGRDWRDKLASVLPDT